MSWAEEVITGRGGKGVNNQKRAEETKKEGQPLTSFKMQAEEADANEHKMREAAIKVNAWQYWKYISANTGTESLFNMVSYYND